MSRGGLHDGLQARASTAHPDIEAFRARLSDTVCQPGAAALRPLWGELQLLWRAADRRWDDGDGDAFLDKWVCRSLWQWLQELEAGVPDALRPALVRHHLWTVEDAVFSCWAATVHRWHENLDGAVGGAWAAIGDIERALGWARRAAKAERDYTLATVIAELPSPRRESEARALLASAEPDELGGVIAQLQRASTALAEGSAGARRAGRRSSSSPTSPTRSRTPKQGSDCWRAKRGGRWWTASCAQAPGRAWRSPVRRERGGRRWSSGCSAPGRQAVIQIALQTRMPTTSSLPGAPSPGPPSWPTGWTLIRPVSSAHF